MACRRLGWKRIPATIVDVDADHLKIEMDENTVRQDFTPTEMVAIKRAVADRVKTPPHIHTDHPDRRSLPVTSGKTINKVAAIVGTSPETLRKAEIVVEAAEADPALAPVVAEMDRTGKVDPAYQKVRRQKPLCQPYEEWDPADEPTGLPKPHGKWSKAPEDQFARMVNNLVTTVDGNLAMDGTFDFGAIVPTSTQLRKVAHICRALGKLHRIMKQNRTLADAKWVVPPGEDHHHDNAGADQPRED